LSGLDANDGQSTSQTTPARLFCTLCSLFVDSVTPQNKAGVVLFRQLVDYVQTKNDSDACRSLARVVEVVLMELTFRTPITTLQ